MENMIRCLRTCCTSCVDFCNSLQVNCCRCVQNIGQCSRSCGTWCAGCWSAQQFKCFFGSVEIKHWVIFFFLLLILPLTFIFEKSISDVNTLANDFATKTFVLVDGQYVETSKYRTGNSFIFLFLPYS